MKQSFKKAIKADNMSELKSYYTDEYAMDRKRKYLLMLKQQGDDGILQFRKVRKIKELVGNVRGLKILDLGCGVGTFALEFAKMGNITVGIDFNNKMISIAKELAVMQDITQAIFKVGEVDSLPFKEEEFDIIIASDIVEHLIPQVLRKCMKECYRVLKKDGSLIIHAQPTRYLSAFNSKKKLILTLSLCWLPPRIYQMYLELLNYHIFPKIRLLIKRDEGISLIHINLPSPIAFKKEIIEAGFNIKVWLLFDLYPELGPEYLRSLKKFFPSYNRKFLERNICAVATKIKC